MLGEEPHADANGNGMCDGCGADVCKHTELEWKDNFDNTHTSVCKICGKQTSTAAHVDAKHNDEAGTEGPDGRCDVCGGLIIEDHQLWTYTDAEGVYDFDNLPGYVLVSSEVDHPAAPGEDIDKVFQPYGVANANGTALSTSDLVALQKRPVSVGMIRQLSASEIVSLSASQVEAIKADADMMAAYEALQTELAASDPAFTSATPYLTGYAIKVVDDSGEYVASRFHVEGAGTGDNSDLTSFESSLTDNVNAENEKVNEVYAVVAEKIADDADLTGGILSSAYAVRYLKTNYDLANRMYYKRAFDAGLTKQLPVLIDGNVWNDVNSDGLMDEEEERIEGAVVRLVRYWYDETGIGYWEQVPGQTPGGDGSFENSGLTREEYDEIVAMADPFKLDEGETMTSEEQKAAADAMTAYINELYASVAAMPEGAARAEAATKNLMKLNVLYHNHTEFLTSYMEVVPGEDEDAGDVGTGGEPAAQAEGDVAGDGETTEPAGVEELVIYSAWANANRDLTVLVGAETPEEEKGVWRRDWTFTQDMLEDLTGRHDLSKDGLGTNYPYLPLTADEALAVADDDEKFFDQNGYEYVPGAGFDRTDENGHWQFLAYGTGTHQASSDSAAFKVLFSYRAEIVSYPDEDVWAPTLQHIGKTVNDWINSDFDDETQALKPNVEDAASHAGDYTLPATDNLNEAMRKAGDLIVLTRLADESESSTTSGAYATYASQPGGSEDVECEHVDEDTATTAADGLCDKCGLCLHEKDENGLCTVEGCQHIGMECCGTATPTEPGEDEGDGDEGDTPVIDVTKPEGGDTTQPSEGDGGEVETFTTRVMAASAVDARADTNTNTSTSTGNGTNTGNGIYSDDYVTEMLAWIATATQDDLDNMDQQRHDAIFGKHQKDAAGNLLYLETTIENGKEVEKVVTNETNVTTGEPNLPYYDNTGSQRLYEAYQARVASLVGDNQ